MTERTSHWQDFRSALPFQTRLTQTKPALPLSNEHCSEVKDQGWQQCCHNKHKKFPYWPTRDVSLRYGHASYVTGYNHENCGLYHNLVNWSILSYKNSIHTTLQCNWCHVCVHQSVQREMRQTGEESDNVGNGWKNGAGAKYECAVFYKIQLCRCREFLWLVSE